MVDVGNLILNIVLVLIGLVAFGGIVGLGVWVYKKHIQYNEYICRIWRKVGSGQYLETFDKAGVFVDPKTKNKRLFLKKNNVGLDPDQIPFIPGKKGAKIIYLLQTGLKNFHYIDVNIDNPAITLSVGEEDINWALNAYERQKKTFFQNKLMQLLPYIMFAVSVIAILALVIFVLNKFSVLSDVATSLDSAARALAQTKANTTVIVGG